MERTHAGAVLEELTPMARAHIPRSLRRTISHCRGGTPHWSRGTAQGGSSNRDKILQFNRNAHSPAPSWGGAKMLTSGVKLHLTRRDECGFGFIFLLSYSIFKCQQTKTSQACPVTFSWLISFFMSSPTLLMGEWTHSPMGTWNPPQHEGQQGEKKYQSESKILGKLFPPLKCAKKLAHTDKKITSIISSVLVQTAFYRLQIPKFELFWFLNQ